MSLSAVLAHRVVPVVVIDDVARAAQLADALVDGALPVAEITLRTTDALHAIEVIAARGDVQVGAGTVCDPAQVEAAVGAGASYIVSPGLREDVVERAAELGVPLVPGCVTPSEVMAAQALGLSTVKFFPASRFGGASTIAALAAPFPDVSFVPTGGIGIDDLGTYLALPGVAAVGGSWMVAPVATGDFAEITRRCAGAVGAVQAIDQQRTPHPLRESP